MQLFGLFLIGVGIVLIVSSERLNPTMSKKETFVGNNASAAETKLIEAKNLSNHSIQGLNPKSAQWKT